MRIAHPHSRATLVRTEAARHREHGYVLVTFGLLLVPLLLMVGLSVDVGSWYSRASDIQKAADAAALAGVVWLPDVTAAKKYAVEAAERNGFKDGNGVTVVVEPVPNQSRRLRVTITDTRVGSFFYKNLGGKDIKLARTGTAEYVMPVPLGSPEAQFGGVAGVSEAAGAAAPGLWGNIHGVRTDTVKGDAFATRCRGADGCTSTNPQNANYRTTGYLYTIDVPANAAGANAMSGIDIEIFDAGLFPRSAETVETGDTNYQGATNANKTGTTWTLYNKDSTELDVNDNPVATSSLCPTRDQAWNPVSPATGAIWNIPESTDTANPFRNKWVSICQTSAIVEAGRYLLRVQTTGPGAGANRYAIRARTNSTAAALKPRVSAYGDMSMYNNITESEANFYLAEIAPEHKGKTIELNLYDPGEVSGNGYLSVINNRGVVATTCTPNSASASRGFTNDVPMSPCTIQTSSNGSPRFNGEWLTLLIPIPTTYSCTVGSLATSGANVGCWWKINYDIGGTANDTTTWAAKVIGDPVHLIED